MEQKKSMCSSQHTTARIIKDRLSSLPEPRLHHILSFLDMKFVVETSLLSKSWRSLWTTLPFLNFTFKHEYLLFPNSTRYVDSEKKFQRFAEQVFSRRESSNILSFRLHTVYDNFSERLIHLALQCNLIEFHLHLQPEYPNLPPRIWYSYFNPNTLWLPHSIFTPNTLTSMELDVSGYSMLDEILFPYKIDLPLLTSLCLRGFYFLTANFLEKISLGCKLLEKLEMIRCGFLENERIVISSHQLKHLKIDKGHFKFNRDNYNIVISTPNLISFQCRDYSLSKYDLLDSLSSLVTADIDVEDIFKGENEHDDDDDDDDDVESDIDDDVESAVDDDVESVSNGENEHADKDVKDVFKGENDAHLVMKYFEGARNVKNMMFNSPNLRVVFNQTSLEISFMPFKGYLWVVMHILKRWHNIHTLVIKTPKGKENSILYYFPLEKTRHRGEEFLFENLKHIEFCNAQGFASLLKVMLKCAITLERVAIFTSIIFIQ